MISQSSVSINTVRVISTQRLTVIVLYAASNWLDGFLPALFNLTAGSASDSSGGLLGLSDDGVELEILSHPIDTDSDQENEEDLNAPPYHLFGNMMSNGVSIPPPPSQSNTNALVSPTSVETTQPNQPNQPNQPLHLTPTMSAAIEITQPLSKVDSAVDDTPASPSESKIRHRRTSSTVSGVFNINDLGE